MKSSIRTLIVAATLAGASALALAAEGTQVAQAGTAPDQAQSSQPAASPAAKKTVKKHASKKSTKKAAKPAKAASAS